MEVIVIGFELDFLLFELDWCFRLPLELGYWR